MNCCKRFILVVLFCQLYLFAATQIPDSILPDSTSQINSLLNAVISASGDTSLVIIADITVHGNKKTKPYIIERELPFRQGQYMQRGELEKQLITAKQQVTNTALFTQVNVYIQSQVNNLVFINVDVKERWYLFPLPYFKLVDRNFNQWWVEQKASLSRVNYGIKFVQNNVSGRNDKLNVNLITGYSRQVQIRYEQPFADISLTKGFSAGFNFSRQRELNYGTDSSKQAFYKQDNFVLQNIRGELAFLYRPAIKTHHTIKLTYTKSTVSDTVLKLNNNYFPDGRTSVSYPELSYTIQYFNTDYNAYPTRGFIGDASIIRRGINKQVDLTQLQYHANLTIPLAKRTQLYLQSAGVIKFPFNQPYFNQQLFGYGDAYLRGLEYYVTDGVAGILGRSTLRYEILDLTLRTPPNAKKEIIVPFRFFIKGGGDIAYTYNKNPGNSLLSNRFLYTECVGLDMVVPSYDIVFKFEYSINQLGGQGIFIHARTDF